ncbi:MAG: hypothetical protein HDS20_00950 [Bacteroides sp.]|nr:hypothetical protein [Bacteroides sp.]
MNEFFPDWQLDNANSYCAINVEIPDDELVQEMIEKFHRRVYRTLTSHRVENGQRFFLEKELHIATTKEEAESIFKQSRENGDKHCIVVSFNATLSQKKYNNLGVVNFKYLCWTKKAWNKAKKAYGNPIVKKLIDCLIGELIAVACQVLKTAVGISF